MLETPCNALSKEGRDVLICELPHGHAGDHQMGERTWKEREW